jgi:hypothetical protein
MRQTIPKIERWTPRISEPASLLGALSSAGRGATASAIGSSFNGSGQTRMANVDHLHHVDKVSLRMQTTVHRR